MTSRPMASPQLTKGRSEPGHAHGRAPGSNPIEVHKRPFALPNRELITHVIHLPFPVSTNAIWRSVRRHVYRSEAYLAWIASADGLCFYLKQTKGPRIEGKFTAEIILAAQERRRAGDLDNRIKVCLDIAQRWNLIRNDSDCEKLSASWGSAPHGAKLVLTELANAADNSVERVKGEWWPK